jgi:hypothetical protein
VREIILNGGLTDRNGTRSEAPIIHRDDLRYSFPIQLALYEL